MAARIPFIGPAAASRIAWRSSSVVVGFASCAVKSTTETVGVGTRSAKPSNFPFRSGMTRATAFAAPVVVGMIDQPGGARAAQVPVRQVEDLLVVRVGVDRRHEAALDRPVVVDDLGDRGEAVRRAGGVRDDVVLRGVVLASLTPRTIVRSSPSAGAEMMTFFAPPFVMWFSAPRTVFPFLFTPSDFI